MKKLLIVIGSIIAAAVLLIYIGLLTYIGSKAGAGLKVKSDVVLVLGEAAEGGTSCFGLRCQSGFVPAPHVNPCLVARVSHAVSLYKDHYASKILMSGGTDPGDNVNEAETMQEIALAAGVPRADILLEKASTSTYENLTLSQKVLHKTGLRSATIVTDPYTDARAGLVASKLGYNYSLSPDVGTSCSHLSDYLLREPLGIIDYIITGKI